MVLCFFKLVLFYYNIFNYVHFYNAVLFMLSL